MKIWLLAAVAAFGMTLAGWDTGIVASAMATLTGEFALSPAAQGMVVAVALCGAAMGSFLCGRLTRAFGARRTIIGLGCAYAALALASSMAPSFAALLACRLGIGLVFGATAVVPVYVAEIARPEKRGAMVSFAAIYTALAILLAYLAGKAIIDAGGGWRSMLATGTVPGLLTALGLWALPESPRQLLAWGQDAHARRVSRYLGLDALAISGDTPPAGVTPLPWRQMFARPVLGLVLVGIGTTFFQQASGINAVLYFAPRLFAGAAGVNGQMAATIGIGLINLLATLVATVLVDRAGRRSLLLWGTAIMDLLLVATALGFWIGAPIGVLALLLCGFVAAYAIGLGAVPWILLSEVYPLPLRERAIGLAVLTLWGTNLMVTGAFPALASALGAAGSFLLFAALSALGVAFICWCVPETRGRTLGE
ncbi:sugar porter family MFS transporter [Sphingomonas sp. OTU376]|uniref:sugar porter family MFS transporter n=1 Tax=Sphingomonas sp. OTU376 TaxID=3043863 RepID=UPI00313F172A